MDPGIEARNSLIFSGVRVIIGGTSVKTTCPGVIGSIRLLGWGTLRMDDRKRTSFIIWTYQIPCSSASVVCIYGARWSNKPLTKPHLAISPAG